MKVRVNQGEMIPRFYGIAYWDLYSPYAIAYPIPINLIVRLFMRVWWTVVFCKPSRLEVELFEAYNRGREDERARWNTGKTKE